MATLNAKNTESNTVEKHTNTEALVSRFVPVSELPNFIKNGQTLGLIFFGKNSGQSRNFSDAPIPAIEANIKLEDDKSEYCEVIETSEKVSYRHMNGCNIGISQNYISIAITSTQMSRENFHVSTKSMYETVFSCLRQENYHNVFRIWNFIPRITELETGIERYQLFCTGRTSVYNTEFGPSKTTIYPATSCLGNLSNRSEALFFASRTNDIQVINIENSLQMPAYKYPKKYSPAPPAFARATYCKESESCGIIYISGTASIQGHESLHPDNAIEQCKIITKNLTALLNKENLEPHGIVRSISIKDINQIKVYIKKQEHFEEIERYFKEIFSKNAEIVFLYADICRTELLVEVEGIVYIR